MTGAGLAVGAVAALSFAAGLGARRRARGSAGREVLPQGQILYEIDQGSWFHHARQLSRLFDENVDAEIDGPPGKSWLKFSDSLDGHRKILILDWMESRDGERRRGLGRRLMGTLEARAKASGATAILALCKDVSGQSPLPFYLAAGFKVVYAHPEVPQEDLCIILKDLRDPTPAAGSMAAHIEETSRSRMQAIPGQSFSRAEVLTRSEAARKLISEFNALSNTRIDRVASESIQRVLAPHKKLLWIDLLKVNDEKKGRGLGASAVDRAERWAQRQGATAAVAVSYDYTKSCSPLLFWENRGYDALHEDEEGAGGTGAAIIFKEMPHA
jgi:GNAT superfamily N-acetyltransferase